MTVRDIISPRNFGYLFHAFCIEAISYYHGVCVGVGGGVLVGVRVGVGVIVGVRVIVGVGVIVGVAVGVHVAIGISVGNTYGLTV